MTLGSVIAVVVLVLAVVLGLDHRVSRDLAVAAGALAVARLT